MFEFIVIAIIVAIVWAIGAGISQGNEIQKFRGKLEEEYPDQKIYVSISDGSFLVVDFHNEKIVTGLQKERGSLLVKEQPYRSEIAFSDIVKVDVLKDGTQVATTNRGSQAVGAAVGAVAFGGVGAIIGGLSGSSTSTSGVKRMSIQVTVEDNEKPLHEITFYETSTKKGGQRGSIFFDQAAQEIAKFAAYLESAMRKVASRKQAPQTHEFKKPANTLADQIGELWKLKEMGALTQEEYDSQKLKLMRS